MKSTHPITGEALSMTGTLKRWIVWKLARWCEEEMVVYVDFIREYDYIEHQISLREQPYDPEALPF